MDNQLTLKLTDLFPEEKIDATATIYWTVGYDYVKEIITYIGFAFIGGTFK